MNHGEMVFCKQYMVECKQLNIIVKWFISYTKLNVEILFGDVWAEYIWSKNSIDLLIRIKFK